MNDKIAYTIIGILFLAVLGLGIWTMQEGANPETKNQISAEKPINKEIIAYIKQIYTQDDEEYLKVDYIQFLTGKEATKAAKKDGNKESPGGFYIRNQDVKISTLKIADNVKVRMQTLSRAPNGNFNFNEKITYEAFKNAFKNKTESIQKYPYNLTIKDGAVTKVIQKYIP